MTHLMNQIDASVVDASAWLDRPVAADCVAQRYRGVWRRTLLRDAAGCEDRATRVFWLQTARVHVDLRVSADRSDFEGVSGLDALPRDMLVELARQQGFAGFTGIEPGAPDVCTWHRQIDFSPPADTRDIGTMRFESPGVLLEDGVDAHYHERWEREPASDGPTWAARVPRTALLAAGALQGPTVEHASDEEPMSFLARAGGFFMFARARSATATAWLAQHRGRTLAQVVGDPSVSLEQARALLDFEISLGRVAASPGVLPVIALSTHPWREGRAVPFELDPDTEIAEPAGIADSRSNHVDD
ncbi:hypothetical protein LJ655_05855 [Paraburkholderia sp. MMS20-SJTN17]|uniref:Uncharacterized protein n=1 Tax=Paraburkholderia translucens TaxID=2886945 RepID=A0ABS8K9J6_9BURK|nr:hypothetical protein [Paraburkholderia sp. MMS20-SJTN17]MCC8401422.1 hypothetical protein [Paraburkholderia sp. MMS20-SJTN17]